MGQWISKTLHIPGDTLLIHTPSSTGSGDLCNDAIGPMTLKGILPMLWTNTERSFYLNIGNNKRNIISLISPMSSFLVVCDYDAR